MGSQARLSRQEKELLIMMHHSIISKLVKKNAKNWMTYLNQVTIIVRLRSLEKRWSKEHAAVMYGKRQTRSLRKLLPNA
jgi:hypothetical protein